MMTKFKTLSAVLATTAVVALGSSAWAQDQEGPNAADGAGEGEAGAVAQMAMAQDLYAYGSANKDALAIATAAKIAMSVEAEDVEREKETSDIEGFEGTEEGEGVDAPVTPEMMLAEAEELAGEDEALKSMIADIKAEGSRGRIGGASRTLSRLPAGKTDVFKVPFYGGRLAELAIVGDGDANLDLVVTDEGGNVICLDRSYSDKLYCSWTPRWDGYFFIGVRNQGRIRNSYYILTN
ncbi:hypothetical protein [Vannielia litorea]|uniref:hypothetical protein n=1 Tax=Vannielia TaxID=2813041 RepID=UPI001C97394E|nr:hypothetical protein [Vannielia litorea]MBY6049126.1 hypothetical protein [Vannielia litorea]MBY6076540.1 hypothetical protein [Vannielia litorea]